MYTTDFYFTNKLPSNIVVLPQGANNNTPNMDQAETADPTFFYADPLQLGGSIYICGCYTHHKHPS